MGDIMISNVGRPRKYNSRLIKISTALPMKVLFELEDQVKAGLFTSRNEAIISWLYSADKDVAKKLIEDLKETRKVIRKLKEENKNQQEKLNTLLEKFSTNIFFEIEVPKKIEKLMEKYFSKPYINKFNSFIIHNKKNYRQTFGRVGSKKERKNYLKQKVEVYINDNVETTKKRIKEMFVREGIGISDDKKLSLILKKVIYTWWQDIYDRLKD